MSDPPVVVVGGWASPFVVRVCVALKLKGVEYEFLQEEAGRKSELLLRSNPVYKKMPLLLQSRACFQSRARAAPFDAPNAEEAFVEQVAVALRQLEEAFVECSRGKRYFGSDDVGFLDIVLGSYVGWFGAAERITGLPVLDEAMTPRLAAWAARFCAHEAVRYVMPDAARLVEFGEVLHAALAANASARS